MDFSSNCTGVHGTQLDSTANNQIAIVQESNANNEVAIVQQLNRNNEIAIVQDLNTAVQVESNKRRAVQANKVTEFGAPTTMTVQGNSYVVNVYGGASESLSFLNGEVASKSVENKK